MEYDSTMIKTSWTTSLRFYVIFCVCGCHPYQKRSDNIFCRHIEHLTAITLKIKVWCYNSVINDFLLLEPYSSQQQLSYKNLWVWALTLPISDHLRCVCHSNPWRGGNMDPSCMVHFPTHIKRVKRSYPCDGMLLQSVSQSVSHSLTIHSFIQQTNRFGVVAWVNDP